MCDRNGVKLVLLPPYSPDYNPIETCFSVIKAFLKRHFENSTSSTVEDALIESAKHAITAEKAFNLYENCGYGYRDPEALERAEQNWEALRQS